MNISKLRKPQILGKDEKYFNLHYFKDHLVIILQKLILSVIYENFIVYLSVNKNHVHIFLLNNYKSVQSSTTL